MTSPEAARLHKWAMWRIVVNQELIHGLESATSAETTSGGQSYHSFMDNYSVTQRYIQNPHVQRDETVYIRNNYGMPPSPKYPMGDTLFFLYGLPRVSVTLKVPGIMSSHYSSVSSLILKDSHADIASDKMSSGRAPTQSVNADVIHTSTTGEFRARHETICKKIRNPGLGKMSPVNFRDKPEADYPAIKSQFGSEKVNNINKPVLVPPSVFRKEILSRSNIDLPLNINEGGENVEPREQDSSMGEAFEGPRVTLLNGRRGIYAWSEKGDPGFAVSAYVDESHMKTHI